MDTFTLDFDLEGKGYLVVVTPQALPDGMIYNAQLEEDKVIRFLGGRDGTLLPVTTGVPPKIVNAIATRILERVHMDDRNKTDPYALL
ncbi:hypothetical protein GA0116948_101139 [Chitinophaga costaii]|uniref:Uncharacterized protein n=1 Tax=Chitinophaga costaii TaxID=1335309 RepID=A0A1C3YWS4_9BACT|nr:hypothetical protein [Chitinophaga costaii]PUZ30131.1 hypothetical protein DCM91_01265 [Chitinophaga costaii]SCB74468.1 hypothetical protein GA0116948_101139 [Chitinophaga costaii]